MTVDTPVRFIHLKGDRHFVDWLLPVYRTLIVMGFTYPIPDRWRMCTISYSIPRCIEITGDPNLLIISVYLPCKGSPNSQNEFQECIDPLHEIMSTYEQTHVKVL